MESDKAIPTQTGPDETLIKRVSSILDEVKQHNDLSDDSAKQLISILRDFSVKRAVQLSVAPDDDLHGSVVALAAQTAGYEFGERDNVMSMSQLVSIFSEKKGMTGALHELSNKLNAEKGLVDPDIFPPQVVLRKNVGRPEILEMIKEKLFNLMKIADPGSMNMPLFDENEIDVQGDALPLFLLNGKISPNLPSNDWATAAYPYDRRNIEFGLRIQSILMDSIAGRRFKVLTDAQKENIAFQIKSISVAVHELSDCARNNYFGHNSIKGQFQRLIDCQKLRNEVKEDRKHALSTYTSMAPFEAFDQCDKWIDIVNFVWPISSLEETGDKKESFVRNKELKSYFESSLENPDQSIIPDMHINNSAGVGPYIEKKSQNIHRAEMLPSDILNGNALLDYLNETVQDDVDIPEKVFNFEFPALVAANQWMRTVSVRGKDEVYEIKDIDKKVRNYYVYNSVIPTVSSFLLQGPHYEKVLVPSDSFPITCLVGYNPTKGGLDELIKDHMISKVSLLVYADNLYYVDDVSTDRTMYLSLDGSKMESTISLGDVYNENARILQYFYGLNPVQQQSGHRTFLPNENIRREYILWLEWVSPLLTISPYGLIATAQVKIPGMTSGATGTAYYNTHKMIKVACLSLYFHENYEHVKFDSDNLPFWDAPLPRIEDVDEVLHRLTAQKLSPLHMRENFDSLTEKTRVPIEVELACRVLGVRVKCEKFFKRERKSLFADQDEIDPALLSSLYPIDMLGFDAVKIKSADHEYFIPVLSRDRVLKSMLFHKYEKVIETEKRKDGKEGNPESLRIFFDLVSLHTLYLVGGWYHSGINDIIYSRILKLLEWFQIRKEAFPEETVEFVRKTFGTALASMASMRMVEEIPSSVSIPTLFEVFSLYLPQDRDNVHLIPDSIVLELMRRSPYFADGGYSLSSLMNTKSFIDFSERNHLPAEQSSRMMRDLVLDVVPVQAQISDLPRGSSTELMVTLAKLSEKLAVPNEVFPLREIRDFNIKGLTRTQFVNPFQIPERVVTKFTSYMSQHPNGIVIDVPGEMFGDATIWDLDSLVIDMGLTTLSRTIGVAKDYLRMLVYNVRSSVLFRVPNTTNLFSRYIATGANPGRAGDKLSELREGIHMASIYQPGLAGGHRVGAMRPIVLDPHYQRILRESANRLSSRKQKEKRVTTDARGLRKIVTSAHERAVSLSPSRTRNMVEPEKGDVTLDDQRKLLRGDYAVDTGPSWADATDPDTFTDFLLKEESPPPEVPIVKRKIRSRRESKLQKESRSKMEENED